MRFIVSLLTIWCIMPFTINGNEKPNSLSIIPMPEEISIGEGIFRLDSTTVLLGANSKEAEFVAAYLADRIHRASGYQIAGDPKGASSISLKLDPSIAGKEEYHLSVSPAEISIRASAPAGLFYGVQTLFQLMPPAIYGNSANQDMGWSVPAVEIHDRPRFEYRGMQLDVGRHFFSVEHVKSYIDYLAMHKMNRFHWHLTEDQGWRIEIKKYPKLAEVSAWRKETLIGHAGRAKSSFKFDGKRYGGYYTHDEIRDVVAYAAERQITIIPEIELPGHSLAALAAYPELGCTDGPFEVGTYWGVVKDVYCPNEGYFHLFRGCSDRGDGSFPFDLHPHWW